MIKWTKAQRYRKYSSYSAQYQSNLKKKIQNSNFRLQYHIQADTGLLNDPNGFSYYNQQWHLFYQSFPFGPVHGLKAWQHLVSDDLVHWQEKGFALKPDSPLDSQGAYSGSARQISDKLAIFYTGNVRDSHWIRHPYQIGAFMDKKGHVQKINRSLISQPPFTSDHFRDPYMFVYQKQLFAIIGAQRKVNHSGAIYLYQARQNDFLDWQLVDELHFSDAQQGYMIECPNLVFIGDKPLLIFCPQGLDHKIAAYKNIYPNQAILGQKFLPDQAKISYPQKQINLDEGFDLYATQAFNAPDGRVLAVSWIGLPDVSYPTDTEDWSGCLSLVKELKIKNNHLYQYPVTENLQLRKAVRKLSNEIIYRSPAQNSFELQLTVPTGRQAIISVMADSNGRQGLTISVDMRIGIISVDRTGLGWPAGNFAANIRETHFPKENALQLNCFLDSSAFEIYLNSGEKVMTGRVFPDVLNDYLKLQGCEQIRLWPLEKTNTN